MRQNTKKLVSRRYTWWLSFVDTPSERWFSDLADRVYSLRFIIRNFQLTLKASKAQFRFSSAPYRKRLAVVTRNKHKNCKIIIFSEISGIIKQAFLQKWFTLTWTRMAGSRTSDRHGCFYHPCLSQILTV